MSKQKITKPKKRSKKEYDYNECKEYISKKLGYDIDNVPGKTFRCFWHELENYNELHNGSHIWIFSDSHKEKWAKEIAMAFEQEFGEGPYYCSW